MAHGKRAEIQGHIREVGSRRLYGWYVRNSYAKTLTHRRERAATRRLEYRARYEEHCVAEKLLE